MVNKENSIGPPLLYGRGGIEFDVRIDMVLHELSHFKTTVRVRMLDVTFIDGIRVTVRCVNAGLMDRDLQFGDGDVEIADTEHIPGHFALYISEVREEPWYNPLHVRS